MDKTIRRELRQTVERRHGGIASFVQSVPVEVDDGRSIWGGVVGVFDLVGNRHSSRAYAWCYRRENGRRRFIAVLHLGPAKSPVDAMKVALFAEGLSGTY